MKVHIEPKKVIAILGLLYALIFGAYLAALLAGVSPESRLFLLLDPNEERNLPSVYNAFGLLFCAALLYLIAGVRRMAGDRDAAYWLGLCGVFVFLSADEYLAFHERLIGPVHQNLQTSGLLGNAWVIPYGLLLLLLGGLYLRFFLNLPPDTRRWFFASALAYVGGALGMEMVGGAHTDGGGSYLSAFYLTATFLEETLESLGLAMFVYALLLYIRRHVPGFSLGVAQG